MLAIGVPIGIGPLGDAVDLVGERPDGRLGRPVHVREPRRQERAQLAGEGRRERLAAEHEVPDAGRARRGRPGRRRASTPATACTAGASRRGARRARRRVSGIDRRGLARCGDVAVRAGDAAAVDEALGLEQQVERGEHGIGVDAEVDEAGDLVDADGRDLLDDRRSVGSRAEQPARARGSDGPRPRAAGRARRASRT